MRRFKNFSLTLTIVLLGMLLLVISIISAQQATGVTAEPLDYANIRAGADINAETLGQIYAGAAYPILGRHEVFPWLLLGDPVTLQPIGWVFRDIVEIKGNINTVPFSDVTISPNAPVPTATQPAPVVLPGISNTTNNTTNITPTPASGAVINTSLGGNNTANTAPNPDNNTVAAAPATLAPTDTPVFTVAGSVQGEVNIRYGPGADYPRVGVATPGERFQITGYHTQLPWVRIRYDASPNGQAWIFTDLLQVEGNIYTLEAISTLALNLPTLTPTPSVVQSANISGETVPISTGFQVLGNNIWANMLRNNFDPATSRFGAFFMLDLQTGEAITFGSEFAFSGTSLNKVAILTRLYGSLDSPPNAQLATDIANTMICSENAATNRLLNYIGDGDEFAGAAEVTEMLRQLDMTESFITYPYALDPNNPPTPTYPVPLPRTSADQVKANPDLSNQVTVDEMGWLLASIYQCGYEESGPLIETFGSAYEPRECRQMLHVMSNNNVDAMMKAGTPANTRVAHKHGWIFDTHGNAGVFFTPGGDYVAVMMLHQPNWLQFETGSLPVFAETGRLIYNYFNPETPMERIRAGFIPDAPTCNFAGTPLITDLRQPIWND